MAIRKFDRRAGDIQPDEQVVTVRYTRPNQPEEIIAYQMSFVAPVGATEGEIAQYVASVKNGYQFKKVVSRHVAGCVPTSYATQEIWGW